MDIRLSDYKPIEWEFNLSRINWDADLGLYQEELMHALSHPPTADLWQTMHELFPETQFYSFARDLQEIKLLSQALHNGFDQLRTLRHEKVSTHALGHATATLFDKLVTMLNGGFNRLGNSWRPNAVLLMFKEIFQHHIWNLKAKFAPIYTVLTASVSFPDPHDQENAQEPTIDLTKHEKDLLMRAFFPDFVTVWENFARIEWENEYLAFYHAVLARLRNTLKTEKPLCSPTSSGELPQ